MILYEAKTSQPKTATDRKKNSFRQLVLEVVSRIPAGRTMTYKEVAARAGMPRAFRAVGNILNKNRNPKIPCHRVIRSDGKLGGYNRGTNQKKILLQKEGAIF